MKSLKNLFYMLLVLAVGGFATSCSEDDTDTVAYSEGFGVYFSIDQSTFFNLEDGQDVVQVPVYRSKSGAAEAFEMTVVALYDDTTIFTVPSTARFEAGQAETTLDITYSFSKLSPGKTYSIHLELYESIDDPSQTNISAYGLHQIDIKLLYDPWTSLGTGYFRDDIAVSLYNYGLGMSLLPGQQTPVEIQQSDLNKELYRMVEPYGPVYASQLLALYGITPDIAPYYVTPAINYIQFRWIEDGRIYFNAVDTNGDGNAEFQCPGMNLGNGEGDWTFLSYCDMVFGEGAPTDTYGSYDPETKQITFPVESIIVECDMGQMLVNIDGNLRIVMPGGIYMEPTVTAQFVGLSLSADMLRTATFKAEMSEDCSMFLYTLAEGELTPGEVKAVASQMLNDEIDYEVGFESGEYTLVYPRKGAYTVVMQPIATDDEDLTFGTPSVLVFEDESDAISPTDFNAGIEVRNITQTRADFRFTPNSDKIPYYFDMLPREDFETLVEASGSLEQMFTDQLNGYIEYLNQATGYYYTLDFVLPLICMQGNDYLEYQELLPDTEYAHFSLPIDLVTGEVRGEVMVGYFTTLSFDDATDEYLNWVGEWKATSKAGFLFAEDALSYSDKPLTFNFKIVPDSSNESYYVYNWDASAGVPSVDFVEGKICFPNNQNFGYNSSYDCYELFGAYFTYDFTFDGDKYENNLEYDFDIFDKEHPYILEGTIEGDNATIAGLTTTKKLLTGYEVDEEGEIVDYIYSDLEVKYAGMTCLAVTNRNEYTGIFAAGKGISLGDYTLERVPQAETQSLNRTSQLPVHFRMATQELVEKSGKVIRAKDFENNNYVMVR